MSDWQAWILFIGIIVALAIWGRNDKGRIGGG